MGDAALALLRPLAPTLRELDLNGGRITSRGTPALAGFSQLTRLDLGGGLLSGGLLWCGGGVEGVGHEGCKRGQNDACPSCMSDEV